MMQPSKQVAEAMKAINKLDFDDVLHQTLTDKMQDAYDLLADTKEELEAAGL